MINDVTLDATKVAEELRPIVLRLARELRREAETLGVTSTQVALLGSIKTRPGLSLRELAAVEGISAPALSGLVDRLEQAGLIRRVRAADDRRRVGLDLTPEGRKLLRRVTARRTSWLATRLEELEPAELERIVEALEPLRRLV
jgi:DNA-binding MarR family transcriptional regulator